MVMKKSIHLAKANIRKQKSASVSLFVIILLVSALCTIGLSLILGVTADYEEGLERLNSLHSAFIMSKEVYRPEYEEIIQNDPRVTEYDIGEVIHVYRLYMDYGGEFEPRTIILNANDERKVSAPQIIGEDESIPREAAIYLPVFARNLGFETGTPFTLTYRNKPIDLIVAGFFETSELMSPNGMGVKFFVADECYQELKSQMGSSVWISVRFLNPYDSTSFNEDFCAQINEEISFYAEDSFVADIPMVSDPVLTPTMILSVILLLFALIIVVICLLVTRFRVTNSIEDAMHAIGVLKATGYTSGQIIKSYLAEYSVLALPAAFIGLFLAIPVFPVIRQALEAMTGFSWTLKADIPVGLLTALLIVAALLLMVLRSCRKIHKLPPVDALRGGIATNSRRRNSFPLHKGAGNVHTRLGLKSARAYLKQYMMIGVVLAAATFAIIILVALYQNFVLDSTAIIKMTGIERSDIDLTVARHTDANALAAELERLPEVRSTSMYDWYSFRIDGVDTMAVVSNDFSRMENVGIHEGRFPRYDNEVAIPKLLANRLGKTLGETVSVKANGVSQEYIICGYFSTTNNGGQMGMITLEGYQRLDPNYRRSNIKVYLNEGVTFEAFSELLKTEFGVVNVYLPDENDRFAAAKARAEEKIANYLEYYGIDSVDYAVIYNGEIILSGSSGAYQIERITDFNEWAKTQVGSYGDIVKLLTQVVSLICLGIIALILTMTVRQIVTKRRHELGILKSGGYTTGQLARQLAISFLPCAVIGVFLGCLGGALMVNPAITAMFASSGVYNANVHISTTAAALVGVLTLLFTFAVANVSAIRIRRITVYELLSE